MALNLSLAIVKVRCTCMYQKTASKLKIEALNFLFFAKKKMAVFKGWMIDLEEAATKLTKPSPLKPYPPHLHHVLTRCHSCQGWGTSGRDTPAKDIQKDKWKKFKSVPSIVQSPNQLVNTIESPVIFVQKKSADWLYPIMPSILVKPQKLHLSQSSWYPRCFFFGSRSVQSNLPSIQSLDCYAGYTTGSRPHVLDELDVSSEVSCHMSWQALSIFSSRLQLMGPGTCIATNAASCWVLQLPPSSRIHHWRDPHLFAASMPCALWAISTTDWFLAWKNRSKEQIAAFSGKVSSCQLPADLHSSGFYPDLHFIRIWEENHKNFPPCFHGET